MAAIRHGARSPARGVLPALLCCLLLVSSVVRADEQDDTMRLLAEAIAQVKSRYVGAVDGQKLRADAIRGMLQGLDPYSDYLDADAYRELKQDNGGQFGGLGMEVGMDAGAVRVVSAYEDAPAFQAGVRPGDLITRIDNVAVEGMTLDQAIQRARGEPDTTIELTLLHKGDSDPQVVTVKRAIVQSRSVKSALVGANYAYARISHFDQRTPAMLLAALDRMHRESAGAMKGVLLDLRDNPGGLLKSAVGVSSIFLPDDSLVVYTEAAAAESRLRLRTSERSYLRAGAEDARDSLPYLKNVPLVVLVNAGSASASEVLAGALQDQHRAIIAGTQTFGKASVQVLVPLSDGSALKLTTAHYLTPAGQRIQGKGVTPDRVIERPVVGAGANGKSALPDGKAVRVANAACRADAFVRKDVAAIAGIVGTADDCQLAGALELLHKLPVMARN